MSTAQVWLTRDAYERLQAELAELVSRRAPARGAGGRDTAEQDGPGEQRDRESRIRRLREVLSGARVGTPPDDGIAEPGMVLTVRFDGEADTETFLLAHRGDAAHPGLETCSPDSPLGRAVTGAREGEQRRCTLPDGRDVRVVLVRALPYGDRLP